jgi:hypothetical protein
MNWTKIRGRKEGMIKVLGKRRVVSNKNMKNRLKLRLEIMKEIIR